MSAFDVEKGSQQPGGMPQAPVPAATAHEGFLPTYEDAVKTNLRNFERIEGYRGRGVYERTQKADKSTPTSKRCLVFGLPLLLILMVAIGVGLAVFHHERHSAGLSSPSSITVTKWHTATVPETQTFSPSIPVAIARAASSFYDEQATFTSTIWDGTKSVGFSLITTTVPLPSINMSPSQATITTPLPTVNMVLTSSALYSSTTTIFSTATSSPIASVDPLGDGFCGLPGTFCAGGKRDAAPEPQHTKGDGFCGLPGTLCLGSRDSSEMEVERRDGQEKDGGRSSSTLITVTKHLTFTTTSTASTTASIPASIIAAANAYYQQWSSTFFSTASSSLQESSSSSIPASTTAPLPPVTVTVTPKSTPESTKSKQSESSAFVTCVRGGLTVLDTPCYQ